jgi:uncharacterized protein (DUF2141 family)
MKNLSLIATLYALFAWSDAKAQSKEFELEVENLKVNGGQVVVSLYNQEADWFEKPYQEFILSGAKDKESVTFKVPYGIYAISIYQDESANGDLDRNFIGIPKEPIAFGNNYKPFGDPKFENASVRFDENSKKQILTLYTVF